MSQCNSLRSKSKSFTNVAVTALDRRSAHFQETICKFVHNSFVIACVLLTTELVQPSLAESLYISTSQRLDNFSHIDQLGFGGDYNFIIRYATSVNSLISVSLTKVVPASSSDSTKSGSSTQPASPLVLHGQRTIKGEDGDWQVGFIVSCDLTPSLNANEDSNVIISGTNKAIYDGTFKVKNVTATEVYVDTGKQDVDPGPITQGTMSGVFCLQTKPANTFSVSFAVTPVPTSFAYLYLTKNALFNDTIHVATDSTGLLSSSDTSSPQQITAILTELAQIAASAAQVSAKDVHLPNDVIPSETRAQKMTGARQRCFGAVSKEVTANPFYAIARPNEVKHWPGGRLHWEFPLDADTGVSLAFDVTPLRPSLGLVTLDNIADVELEGRSEQLRWHNGLIAYSPVAGIATVTCKTNGVSILLSSPTNINLYAESQFVDPQRDFLTNPQDTFTFSAGFLVDHKYSDQSSGKTIVDAITAPLRAIIPSVSVTQSTQVVTGGGKPDQTTATTTQTVAPPKSP